MPRLLRIWVWSLLPVSSVLWPQEPPQRPARGFARIPSDVRFLDEAAGEGLHPHWKAVLRWPSPTEVEARRVNGPGKPGPDADPILVEEAIDSTFEWLGKMLRPEWVPGRDEVEVLALVSEIEGADAIRFRYQVDHYFVQVTSIHPTLWVAVKDVRRTPGSKVASAEEGAGLLEEALRTFVRIEDEERKRKLSGFEASQGGYLAGRSLREPWGNWTWSEFLRTWTDGDTLLIYAPKISNPAHAPGDYPRWLSVCPRRRHGARSRPRAGSLPEASSSTRIGEAPRP